VKLLPLTCLLTFGSWLLLIDLISLRERGMYQGYMSALPFSPHFDSSLV
jgi:hypothetical protein